MILLNESDWKFMKLGLHTIVRQGRRLGTTRTNEIIYLRLKNVEILQSNSVLMYAFSDYHRLTNQERFYWASQI